MNLRYQNIGYYNNDAYDRLKLLGNILSEKEKIGETSEYGIFYKYNSINKDIPKDNLYRKQYILFVDGNKKETFCFFNDFDFIDAKIFIDSQNYKTLDYKQDIENIEIMECIFHNKNSDTEYYYKILKKMGIKENDFDRVENINNELIKKIYKNKKGKKCFVLHSLESNQDFIFLKDFNGISAKNFIKQFKNDNKLFEKSIKIEENKIKTGR